MNAEEILKFANESIYDNVEYLGVWQGYDIWEPGFSDDAPHCIGFPSFILVKGNYIRWTNDWEESHSIMQYFSSSNEGNEED